MNDVTLPAVLRAFDLCVIESVSSPPGLCLLSPAPAWMSAVFAAVPAQTGAALGEATPFLAHFLTQAEAAWHEGREARAASGPFVVTAGDDDVLLSAVALTQAGRRLLILQRRTGEADLRPTLQRARELTLEQERVVRQVGALHAPAAAIDRDLKALVAAALPGDQHAVIERLLRASAELQAALATLPAPTSRHRRQARK